jgi:predicted DNA-binding transcriptional regulator YafY
MGTGTIAERVVLPFGLFFLGHQWYLAAKDAAAGDEGPVKNFRLSRISHATVNAGRPNSADYDIPASFRLSDHAKSREAWELGDTATVDAVVRFTGESGPTVAARRLGTPVAGAPDRRQFEVRRLDTFARWLLSFGGEVEPVSPNELVTAYRDLVDATLAVYAEA